MKKLFTRILLTTATLCSSYAMAESITWKQLEEKYDKVWLCGSGLQAGWTEFAGIYQSKISPTEFSFFKGKSGPGFNGEFFQGELLPVKIDGTNNVGFDIYKSIAGKDFTVQITDEKVEKFGINMMFLRRSVLLDERTLTCTPQKVEEK